MRYQNICRVMPSPRWVTNSASHQLACEQGRTAFREIAPDPVQRFFAQRHQTFLAALAHHAHHAHVQAHLRHAQADQLGHAQAAGVQHFQHGAVAQAQRRFDIRRIQQQLDILFGEALGQAARQLGRGDLQGGVGGYLVLPQQVAEQALEAGDGAARCWWLWLFRRSPDARESPVYRRAWLASKPTSALLLQPCGELVQVAPVAFQRVARQAVFQPQAVAEFVEQASMLFYSPPLEWTFMRQQPALDVQRMPLAVVHEAAQAGLLTTR